MKNRQRRPFRASFLALIGLLAAGATGAHTAETSPQIELKRDDARGLLSVLIDGKEAVVYCYGSDLDLPHYYPVRSPAGKSMTVEHPNPYPHHRSFWFGDRVHLAGQRDVTFYAALYSKQDKEDPKSPFRDRVRHVEFVPGIAANADAAKADAAKNRAEIAMKLIWEMDLDKPVLDELREMRVVALGDGEYLLDIKFTVKASYGEVTFTSDAVHYAWPYIRMNTQFSVDGGGTITNSEGGVNQQQTNGKDAQWIDYSNTVEGETAGLAIFSHTENGQPHAWLTRDYGCFGPRRVNARSGKPFTLAQGESLSRRVGILVHTGDVNSGQVAARYRQYVEGKL